MKKFIQIKDTQNVDCTIFIEHISLIKNIENTDGYGDGNTIIYLNDKTLFLYTHSTYAEVLALING
jgi:hypothetical protein